MTIEQHLRVLIGDLVLRVAEQAATIDALKEQLAAKDPVKDAPKP